MIIRRNGHRETVELSIQEALELQAQLSKVIACATRQMQGKPAGLTSFQQAAPIVDVEKARSMPGVLTFSVSPEL